MLGKLLLAYAVGAVAFWGILTWFAEDGPEGM